MIMAIPSAQLDEVMAGIEKTRYRERYRLDHYTEIF